LILKQQEQEDNNQSFRSLRWHAVNVSIYFI